MKLHLLAIGLLLVAPLPEAAWAQRPATEELVWPLPPDAPRIRYVGQLKSEEDIGKKEGFFSRLKSGLAGTEGERASQLARPYDVYHAGNGRIFVSDGLKGKVLLFDAEGQELRVLGETGQGSLGKPMGIDGDGNGTLYVADARASRVVALNDAGEFIAGYGGSEVLHNPVDVDVDPERDALWVVDSYMHQVVKFSLSTGEVLLRIGNDVGDLTAKREILQNVAMGTHGAPQTAQGDPDAELDGGAIAEEDDEPLIEPRDLLENRGSGPGEFRYPGYVAVAPDGTVFVTDQLNFRIQVFSPEGEYLREVGRHGRVPGAFARPKGIAVDSQGHLYVADAVFNNIQIFDAEGRLLLYFASHGQGEGQMFVPLGVSIDAQDQIWVADRTNERIQIFQYLHVEDPVDTTGESGSR
jgi:DNA-binding beta-propeller fold protein YncE